MADPKVKNKVTYGIKNLHIWPIISTAEDGTPTYGAIINWPGATELSLDAEGNSDPFYADDEVYFNGVTNNGYSGSITSADVPEDVLIQIFGYEKDKNGALIEKSDAIQKEFAAAFEFKGDQRKRRHLLYRVNATRPGISSQTKGDSIEPNTPEVPITALARLSDNKIKSRCEEGDACYDSWFGAKPYESDATIAK